MTHGLLNSLQPGTCLLLRQIHSMRKGLCEESSSVSHNDRDWLDVYRAAAMEFDRDKLPASIDVAERLSTNAYGDCRLHTPRSIANCRMHSTVSRFSRECSSTFGVLKHFLSA